MLLASLSGEREAVLVRLDKALHSVVPRSQVGKYKGLLPDYLTLPLCLFTVSNGISCIRSRWSTNVHLHLSPSRTHLEEVVSLVITPNTTVTQDSRQLSVLLLELLVVRISVVLLEHDKLSAHP